LLNFKDTINLYKFIKKLKFNDSKIAFLYCVSSYPVEDKEANLLSISFLKKKFSFTIGYSDHTLGIHAALAATVIGAKIIEKHFTLDNDYSKFRDHQLSLNPVNMKRLVDSIRSIEYMMGKEQKIIQSSEKKNLSSMRRSLYSSKDINKNSKIKAKDVSIVRPFVSLGPLDLNKVVGRTVKVDLDINMPFFLRNLKN